MEWKWGKRFWSVYFSAGSDLRGHPTDCLILQRREWNSHWFGVWAESCFWKTLALKVWSVNPVCSPLVSALLLACLLGGTSTSASWNPAWIPGWLPERRQDVSSRPWISHLTLWRPLWGLVENHLERNLRLKQSQVTKHRKQLEKPGSGVRRLLNSADFVRSAGNFPLYWQNYFHA